MKTGLNFIKIEVTELQEVLLKILCFLTSSCKAQACKEIKCCNNEISAAML